MPLNTQQVQKCLESLTHAYKTLQKLEKKSIDYDVFRNATLKGFELTLEISGKLLKKSIRPYFATAKLADKLTFKEIFRAAAKHDLLSLNECERWLAYRDNRNTTAHDYDEDFAEETLKLMPDFINDVASLIKIVQNAKS